MSTQYLRRVDQTRNMARSYELSVQPGLFGEVSVIRHWGRIGATGQSKVFWFTNEEYAQGMVDSVLRQKQGRGYVLVTRSAERALSVDPGS